MDLNVSFTIAIATIIFLVYLLYYFVFQNKQKVEQKENVKEEIKHVEETQEHTQQKPKIKVVKQQVKSKDHVFKHKWLNCTLKAHLNVTTGIDFSSNGKYLLSCGNDRALFLWYTKEFDQTQQKHVRCNVEYDHALKIRFCPDSKSFITLLNNSNTIRAFKLVKKSDGSLQIERATSIDDFPQKHKTEIINIGISLDAKYIMTCSKDTTIIIWNLKGEVLGTIDTHLGNNSFGALSNCGRFVAACGFTPDVKVWQVCFQKSNGDFKEIKRAFELNGHSAGVCHFSFNVDSTRMASISKDKTWKLWNTNVEFDLGQNPIVLVTGYLNSLGAYQIALSPDSYSIVVSIDNNLYFYNSLNAQLDMSMESVFNEAVNEMCFSNDNKYLAVCGDRNIKVIHNVTGLRVAVDDCEEKLKHAKTESAKDRLRQMINDFKESISKFE